MKTENPIIWKKEPCLRGECKGTHDRHWWSIPFTAPMGLVTECYHCGKTREVHVENGRNRVLKA